MAHKIAKINVDNDGDPTNDKSWHYVDDVTGGSDSSTLCKGIPICDCDDVDVKTVDKGGITCKHCLSIIRAIKAINL